MTLMIELWQLVTFAVTVVGSLLTLFFALSRMLLAQFSSCVDERFRRLLDDAAAWREVERSVARFREEVARDYVRREDYVRGQTVIEAKLDVISSKMMIVEVQKQRYLSLFSGIEAAHVAWAPLGWECVAVAEIDPAACAVLAHRLPDVPNLGDVTNITGETLRALGQIDVVIGGSPCQDLSISGCRAGLAGSRSGLFHQQVRIFHEAKQMCGARWLIWENVPGFT